MNLMNAIEKMEKIRARWKVIELIQEKIDDLIATNVEDKSSFHLEDLMMMENQDQLGYELEDLEKELKALWENEKSNKIDRN